MDLISSDLHVINGLLLSNLTEKASIEAQIKAAEDASRMREKIELKQQRKKERKAARVALEQVFLIYILLLVS